MAEKKDSYQAGTQAGTGSHASAGTQIAAGTQTVVPEGRFLGLPSQESIDLLTRLLQEFERRANAATSTSTLTPEVERDIAVVIAAFKAIENALALRPSSIKIDVLDPATGSATGGTRVKITGSTFLTGARVRFGNNDARDVSIVSLTEIQATTPPGSIGAVDVVVNTLAGSAIKQQGYTYFASGQVS
jgi:hypothetical protein